MKYLDAAVVRARHGWDAKFAGRAIGHGTPLAQMAGADSSPNANECSTRGRKRGSHSVADWLLSTSPREDFFAVFQQPASLVVRPRVWPRTDQLTAVARAYSLGHE